MTAQADLIRDKRHHFAQPGGSHDRLVKFLSRALPAGIGLVAAVMILVPLSPRGEISFLLDRNKVAVTPERIHVDKAMYRGEDNQGRPFQLTAGSAIQPSATSRELEMTDLVARLQLTDGPAELVAPGGVYNFDTSQVAVPGPVNFSAADGYRMITQNVAIDLKTRRIAGAGGVSGLVPAGTFAADKIVGDLGARTVTLEGNARLNMVPGKMRMPK
ncbi:LPS export ABC transporter periplasmic protein LptC [Novosphingobium sp. JCM 18896]|uniref:LPS export ABC transporter periplasmic protein LptC n=1 Tax=Novosphingobium sp. JCM 18896 TaxID=2989731 RepID=UPI00222310F1|nr:LPS export ABC transporter periplasmic protein LptC [Novosphingobium sp. JCM 18896]MCW1431803.1 LPS export ABC transporter periplasmic protein LptC [Novosphingobium sp. JCM 18896]